MPNRELLDYIKTNLDKGYSIEQVRETLIQHNYKEDEVEEAIRLVTSKVDTVASKTEEKGKIFPKGKIGKIFGIIFVIGLVFLAIQILFSNYMPPNCNPMDYPYGSQQWRRCLEVTGEQARSGYNTLSDCEDRPIKTSCYIEVATKTNNISICDMILELSYEDETDVNHCYKQVALENNNVEICGKLSSTLDKEYCYSQIAMKTRNKTLCENIRPGNYKDGCIRQAEAGYPVN